ncbi:MAG: fibronectin type III domain-containing protein [Candidatus Electrothrix sp. AUS1_2]|nr:fibronectin type III domain-containing protein [Candidatus Electrothrix sp. AUS1_2]
MSSPDAIRDCWNRTSDTSDKAFHTRNDLFQPRSLEAPRQGAGWLTLDWKAPSDGGRPVSYRIERRKLPGGDWETVGMAIATEATLNNQERGKEWEYRVIAANKAGEGEPSNAVMAVL